MARATLFRRLLSLAAGLVVGAAGVVGGSTAATAADPQVPFPGEFFPVCDGTNVLLLGLPNVSWTVEAGEQRFWPDGDEPGRLPAGGLGAVFVDDEVPVSVDPGRGAGLHRPTGALRGSGGAPGTPPP